MAGKAEQLRRINADKLRAALRAAPDSTKAELAAKSGLSLATCNTILNDFATSGEVLETHCEPAGSGRPATRYAYNGDFGHILCAAITNDDHSPLVTAVVYNLLGKERMREVYPFAALDAATLIAALRGMIDAFPKMRVVCAAIPGVVTAEGEVTRHCDIAGLCGCPLRQMLAEAFGIKAFVENDMNLTVLGYCHARQLAPNITAAALLFPPGNFPGAGFMSEGHILHGRAGFAGEIAHLPFISQQAPPQKGAELVPLVADCVQSVIALLAPDVVALFGNLLREDMLPQIVARCREYAWAETLPEICFEERAEEYMLQGLLFTGQKSLVYRPDWGEPSGIQLLCEEK